MYMHAVVADMSIPSQNILGLARNPAIIAGLYLHTDSQFFLTHMQCNVSLCNGHSVRPAVRPSCRPAGMVKTLTLAISRLKGICTSLSPA